MIEKYLTKIQEVTSGNGIYAFRGQDDSKWPLYSTAIRRMTSEGHVKTDDPNFAFEYLEYYKRLMERARTLGLDFEQERENSILQLFAKLQHFGAAMRLLDFTRNPLVVLWFANKNQSCDGKLFVINTGSPIGMGSVTGDDKNYDLNTIFSRTDDTALPMLFWEPTLHGEAMSRILR